MALARDRSTLHALFTTATGDLDDLAYLTVTLAEMVLASGERSRTHAAASLCRLVQDKLERQFGPEHTACLKVAAEQAHALRMAGMHLAAEQLARAVLQRRQSIQAPPTVRSWGGQSLWGEFDRKEGYSRKGICDT